MNEKETVKIEPTIGNEFEPSKKPVKTSGRHTKERQKIEFSKKIIIACLIVNIAVIAVTLYVVIKTFNTQPLCYLIPSVAAEVSSGTAFYFNKSSKENTIKLMTAYNIPITSDMFNKI